MSGKLVSHMIIQFIIIISPFSEKCDQNCPKVTIFSVIFQLFQVTKASCYSSHERITIFRSVISRYFNAIYYNI